MLTRNALTAVAAAGILVGAGLAAACLPDAPTDPGAEPPAAAGPPPRYGIASGGELEFRSDAERVRELDEYAELGVSLIRVDAKWSVVEWHRGVYDWSRLDPVVDGARERGLDVLLTLSYSPEWARPPGTDSKHPPDEEHEAGYGRYAAAVVERYLPRGVTAYEGWNEPNLGCCFWKPRADPETYGRMMGAAHDAMKAKADELGGTITVVGMTLAGARDDGVNMTPNTFAIRAYAAGARMDAVAIHPYLGLSNDPVYEWEGFTYFDTGSWLGPCPSVRCTAAEHGAQIWGTEVGQPVLQLAEEAVPRIIARWQAYPGIGPAFYYTYRDLDSYSLVDPTTWERRPAWYALRDFLPHED